MPLYEFQCATCGPFEQWRTMAESKEPMACPDCKAIAKRVFSSPGVMLNSTFRLRERPSAEPKLVKHQEREPVKPRYQSHAGDRPWMISH